MLRSEQLFLLFRRGLLIRTTGCFSMDLNDVHGVSNGFPIGRGGRAAAVLQSGGGLLIWMGLLI